MRCHVLYRSMASGIWSWHASLQSRPNVENVGDGVGNVERVGDGV